MNQNPRSRSSRITGHGVPEYPFGLSVVLGVAHVFGHVGLKYPLHQSLGKEFEQGVLTDEAFRFLVISQQTVDQFFRDGHFFANSKFLGLASAYISSGLQSVIGSLSLTVSV